MELMVVQREEAMTDERLDSLERRMEVVEGAFPNKDAASHLRYHEELIEANRDRKRLIAAVKEKTIAGLVWAGMLALGIACWRYFLSLVTRGS